MNRSLFLHQGCFALAALLLTFTAPSAGDKFRPKANATLSLNGTQLNSTYEVPRVLQRSCSAENESYCIHGVCLYHTDMNTISCRCQPDFTGNRCEVVLFLLRQNSSEEVISIVCGFVLLLVCVCFILYCIYRKWSRKPTLPLKNQENSI